MAQNNGIGFLGRVPIDTVLVQLLDAVSKGEIPGADTDANTNGNGHTNGESNDSKAEEFPLLERYNSTTSSKVWKGITEGIIAGIDKRREDTTLRLQDTASE